MAMPAIVSFAHLLGVRIIKFGNNLDLRVESWTGIVPGMVKSEDMMIVWNLTKYWMRPRKTFGSMYMAGLFDDAFSITNSVFWGSI